jgi:hypothetical protein
MSGKGDGWSLSDIDGSKILESSSILKLRVLWFGTTETSPFYNTFPLLSLGPFAASDAADFVTLHRPGVPPFSPKEKTAILTFAKGNPLALQVACFHVVKTKQNGEKLPVAMQKAMDDMRVQLRNW